MPSRTRPKRNVKITRVPRPAPDQRLAKVLRRLREEQGLSQQILATRAHMGMSNLSRIETGDSSPAFSTVVGLAAALGVSMVELVQLVEDESGK